MLKKQKSLTERAAEAIKSNASSKELLSIKAEIASRIQQVDSAMKSKQREIEDAEISGDLDLVRSVRHSEIDLKDEDRLLHRQQSELHRAIGIAKGHEAVEATSEYRKKLAKAVEQAEKAQEMMADCRLIANQLMLARTDAAHIGEKLVFSADTIRALAAAMYPQGSNERKQLMLDLGIREAMAA